MATTARSKRTVAPKAAPKAEVPATPAPDKAHYTFVYKGKIHHGLKARIVRTAITVKQGAKRVLKTVQTTAQKIITAAKPVIKRAWTVALRPFLDGVAAGIALGAVVVGAFVAPITTVLALLGTGVGLVLLAKGIKALEQREFTSRAARVVLDTLNIIGRVVAAAVYLGAAYIALALAVVSPAFAVFAMLLLVLGYFDVRGAGTIAFLVWCALSGSWAFGLTWLLWRALVRGSREPVPAYSEMRIGHTEHADIRRAAADQKHVAIGAEEVAHLADEVTWADTADNEIACDACGTTKGALRVRSNALPFVTTGEGVGRAHAASDHTLCSACYDAEGEDNAVAMTGVSLRKRSVNVVLNAVGRAALPEFDASKADVANVYWATVAWWRDRRGNHHERQWDCFHDGKAVASVVYDHARKVYRASALETFLGTKTSLSVAKSLATDTLFDEANAVDRMVEALEHPVAHVPAPIEDVVVDELRAAREDR